MTVLIIKALSGTEGLDSVWFSDCNVFSGA